MSKLKDVVRLALEMSPEDQGKLYSAIQEARSKTEKADRVVKAKRMKAFLAEVKKDKALLEKLGDKKVVVQAAVPVTFTYEIVSDEGESLEIEVYRRQDQVDIDLVEEDQYRVSVLEALGKLDLLAVKHDVDPKEAYDEVYEHLV